MRYIEELVEKLSKQKARVEVKDTRGGKDKRKKGKDDVEEMKLTCDKVAKKKISRS